MSASGASRHFVAAANLGSDRSEADMPRPFGAPRSGEIDPCPSSEEAAQFLRGLFRNFLWKEMTGIERPATDIDRPGSPQRKRAANLCVPSA